LVLYATSICAPFGPAHMKKVFRLCAKHFAIKCVQFFCICFSDLILNLLEGYGHWQGVNFILQQGPQEKIKDGSNLKVVEARKWIPYIKS